MKKLKKLMLSLFMGISILSLSACGGGEESSSELKVALGGQITSLDPALADDTYSMIVIQNMYRTLFKLDEEGKLVKDLCEDYKVSEDGKTYTFTIKDAKWSDGEAVKADDFVYGIKRGLSYGPENSYNAQDGRKYIVGAQKAYEKNMKIKDMKDVGVKKVDDKTFTIELIQPVQYFDKLMTQGIYTPLRSDIAKEKDSEWSLSADVPVNGPFKAESVNPADAVDLVKNTEYYEADKTTLEKLHFKIMEDSVSQYQGYDAGEIDFATYVANEGYTNYKGKDDLYRVDPYVSNYFIDINSLSTENKALQDVNVRKAMAMAVDRDGIVKVLDTGDYVMPLFGLVPHGIQGEKEDFRKEADDAGDLIKYDLKGAQALMKKAGYSDSKKLTIKYKTTGQQVNMDIAQILQEQFKKIYIDLKIEQVEQGVFYQQVDGGQFETSRYGLSATTLDPAAAYLGMWQKESQAVLIFDDAEYEDLMAKAALETDVAKRMQLLHDAENRMIIEQAYFIPLVTNTQVMLKKPSVKGLERTPAAMFYFEHVTIE